MLKIGVLGGAFDPIHFGHIEIAKVVKPDFFEVWIMPCFQHIHGKNMVSTEDRLKMCRLAMEKEQNSGICLSSYEIDNKISGGTYETMIKLQKDIPADYSIIIGQDNAESITTWKNWEKLIKEFRFFVIPRKGWTFSTTNIVPWYYMSPHIFATSSASLSVRKCSSTEAREEIKQYRKNSTFPTMLTKEVVDYIIDKNLYSG